MSCAIPPLEPCACKVRAATRSDCNHPKLACIRPVNYFNHAPILSTGVCLSAHSYKTKLFQYNNSYIACVLIACSLARHNTKRKRPPFSGQPLVFLPGCVKHVGIRSRTRYFPMPRYTSSCRTTSLLSLIQLSSCSVQASSALASWVMRCISSCTSSKAVTPGCSGPTSWAI